MNTRDIRNPKEVIYNVREFTYEEIDNMMLDIAYELVKWENTNIIDMHFEVSNQVYEVLSKAIDRFGGNPGEMLNGFKFMRNIELKETEIKIVLD